MKRILRTGSGAKLLVKELIFQESLCIEGEINLNIFDILSNRVQLDIHILGHHHCHDVQLRLAVYNVSTWFEVGDAENHLH
jgi:hypothetical protein